jgi:hypothetical protein
VAVLAERIAEPRSGLAPREIQAQFRVVERESTAI